MPTSSCYNRPDRVFLLWRFDPGGHNRAIFRSEPRDGDPTRAEVYFGHVSYMLVRPMYHGLMVHRPAPEVAEQLRERYRLDAEKVGYLYLLDETATSFIISGPPSWREAVRGFDEPSLFDYAEPWPLGPEVSWGTVGSDDTAD